MAHLREIRFAAPMVEALRSSGISFHILAIMFVANMGKPGTGGQILFEASDLVVLKVDFSLNKSWPRGFISCQHFQTVTAVTEATASFRHFRLSSPS